MLPPIGAATLPGTMLPLGLCVPLLVLAVPVLRPAADLVVLDAQRELGVRLSAAPEDWPHLRVYVEVGELTPWVQEGGDWAATWRLPPTLLPRRLGWAVVDTRRPVDESEGLALGTLAVARRAVLEIDATPRTDVVVLMSGRIVETHHAVAKKLRIEVTIPPASGAIEVQHRRGATVGAQEALDLGTPDTLRLWSFADERGGAYTVAFSDAGEFCSGCDLTVDAGARLLARPVSPGLWRLDQGDEEGTATSDSPPQGDRVSASAAITARLAVREKSTARRAETQGVVAPALSERGTHVSAAAAPSSGSEVRTELPGPWALSLSIGLVSDFGSTTSPSLSLAAQHRFDRWERAVALGLRVVAATTSQSGVRVVGREELPEEMQHWLTAFEADAEWQAVRFGDGFAVGPALVVGVTAVWGTGTRTQPNGKVVDQSRTATEVVVGGGLRGSYRLGPGAVTLALEGRGVLTAPAGWGGAAGLFVAGVGYALNL